jgi:hypothetical protein
MPSWARLAFQSLIIKVMIKGILPKCMTELMLKREISSSHGGEYDVQSCLLGYTAV